MFADRRKTGRLDLEAIEMAVRSAMHQAGAAALSQLLRFEPPAAEQRRLACPCGHQLRYQQLRTKPLLTALGWSQVTRPYYRCPHCHAGCFPSDAELDIDNTTFSPGVRRMQALRMHTAVIQTADFNLAVQATYHGCGYELVDRDHWWAKRL